MTKQDCKEARRAAENSILAWLVELELARSKSDFQRAATAQRELERRGVRVTYRKMKGVKRAR